MLDSKNTGKIFCWYGGKGVLFKKILEYLDVEHDVYVEPYCGGASIFFKKKPSKIEVLNDIDKDIFNFFNVMKNKETYEKLIEMLEWTLYSREEFRRAIEICKQEVCEDNVLRAWAFFVGQNMVFSGKDIRQSGENNWSRSFKRNKPATFRNKVLNLDWFAERLRNAFIDCIDGLECIKYWDTEKTLFYIDPPYIADTRKDKNVYKHETDIEHHRKLVDLVLGLKGSFVISGYEHDIYNKLLENGWQKVEISTSCFAAGRTRMSNLIGENAAEKYVARKEILYLNTSKKIKTLL